MQNCNPKKVGLVFGAMVGGLHLLWAILVFLGFAQPIIDFILWAHMISPFFVLKPFDISAAITLIVITSVIGYLIGYTAGVIWNKVHKI